ncbi:polysaccharide deacetylase family protein [Desulfonema magnum]|uniref:Polysaccharide deacetylase domain-containing protein n=1 Tax=Desulfonema magnum TaxID=45655 RepID=A0A975C0Q3_9BACT|nr:polysaccharide deacetylase family protein [Desulfonema magnum]QTA93895.1 Polysaccharide deacetylase domain-containing protein [Desulfonema magnum]
MYEKIKLIFLYLSKWMGLFHISRYLTRDGLRILCYHSFAVGEEIEWRPELFIRPETFRKRLQFLKKEKFPVLGLNQAIELLSEKKLPPAATVITIDDGWFATKLYAHDILEEKSYPYTIYLTSYYSMKETPIFNLVVQYMFWKTQETRVDLEALGLPLTDSVQFPNADISEQLMNQIINYGNSQLNNDEKCAFMKRLGEGLGLNYPEIEKTRIFSLLTISEISELSAAGADFQLHTHRHRWPGEEQAAVQELAENKAFLASVSKNPLQHFCYPSGFWKPEQFPYLRTAGIKSATTCEAGLNFPRTPLYALNRFLDSESNSQIEFEAQMCGYSEFLRKLRKIMDRWRGAIG